MPVDKPGAIGDTLYASQGFEPAELICAIARVAELADALL
jgi:hypothetical protein